LADVPDRPCLRPAGWAPDCSRHENATFDDLQWEHRYDRIAAYGQAKVANLLFTYELQRRLWKVSEELTGVTYPV
jgi:hypothetical protein